MTDEERIAEIRSRWEYLQSKDLDIHFVLDLIAKRDAEIVRLQEKNHQLAARLAKPDAEDWP